MKFIQTNFDKLMLFVIFVMIFSGYIYYRFDALERMLDAIIIAIFTIVGVRRVGEAFSTTNVEKVENIDMNASPVDSPIFHQEEK